MDWPSSSTVRQCDLRRALATADEGISLDWSGYKSHQEAVNPSLVTAKRHGQVNFLDLDMSLQRVMARTGATIRVLFRPYRKPGNAYAYIPFTSFHGRHTFRGWVLAELLRLTEGRQKCGERRGVFSTTTYAPEDTHGVSSGQFFKRSHGHGGLSYLLRAAKGSATSFSRPTEPVFSPSATHRSGLR